MSQKDPVETPLKQTLNRRLLPSLSALRSFECAARYESFTLAAGELNLTQSAVSRQVKELELLLGVALFRRVGRRVLLTPTGESFAAELTHDLNRLGHTTFRAIASGAGQQELRVATLPTFASRWLIPRLAKFEAANPELSVTLATRNTPFDLARERFDVAIHFGVDNWPGAVLSHLCDEEMVPVASPEFVAKYGLGQGEAAPIDGCPLLHLDSRASAWGDWFSLVGVAPTAPYRGRRFDQFAMVLSAAQASLGAALLPAYLIEDDLANKTLIQLHETVLKTTNRYFTALPEGDDSAVGKKFVAWLKSEVRPDKL